MKFFFDRNMSKYLASAATTLNIGVGDSREFRDTLRHKEVSHEQEVYRPAVG
jgi:hypothetical protein